MCNQNKILKKYLNLNLNVCEYFDSQRVNRPYCSNPKGNIPLLILEHAPLGCEEPSWFNPKDGYFKTADLPPKKSSILPPNFTPNVATQRPPYFSFSDPNLKDLLEAKLLEKAFLDSLAFTNSTGIKSSPHSNLDTLLRSGMFDFLFIDKLFQFMFDLLGMTQTENSTESGETFGLLKSVMGLAAQTSLKRHNAYLLLLWLIAWL